MARGASNISCTHQLTTLKPNARSLHTHTRTPHYFDLPFTPGTRPEKIRIQKWYTIYKDHITLADYEIHDGMGLELYYN